MSTEIAKQSPQEILDNGRLTIFLKTIETLVNVSNTLDVIGARGKNEYNLDGNKCRVKDGVHQIAAKYGARVVAYKAGKKYRYRCTVVNEAGTVSSTFHQEMQKI